MCVLCGALWTEDHWAEVGDEHPTDAPDGTVVFEVHATKRGARLRDRAHRARLANAIFASRGLQLQDWEGSSYILRDRKGNTAVVPDLAHLWQAVERILGYPLDPLETEFLASLRARQATGAG